MREWKKPDGAGIPAAPYANYSTGGGRNNFGLSASCYRPDMHAALERQRTGKPYVVNGPGTPARHYNAENKT